jgi:thiamine-monophosphate kinase
VSARRGEDAVLARLRRRLARAGNRFLGDDAAVLQADRDLAVTVDQHQVGVHFHASADVRQWGERLVRVALSDVAAMGGDPRWALLAVSGVSGGALDRLLATVASTCRRFGADLAGGDLARGDRAGASLTVLATRPPRGRWVRRAGGRPGDRL